MNKRHILLTLLLLSLLGTTAWGDLQSGLVAHWAFDDGSGTTATDSSGNGNHGTLNGAPRWVEGLLGGALDFAHANTNECVVVPAFEVTSGGITLAAWVKPRSFAQADARIIDKGTDVAAANDAWWMLSPVSSGGQIRLRFRLRTNENATTATQIATSGTLVVGEWHHTAAVWDGASMILYQDAAEVGRVAKGGTAVAANANARVYIGNQLGGAQRRPFDGLIDDACVFSRALAVAELQELMAGFSRDLAYGPTPTDGGQDVPRDVVLTWMAGERAATHDVYFGTGPAEVGAADRTTPMGVLVSRGQTATMFTPAGLEFGRTYYWRIDEIGAPPDNTIFKGDVWSFTVEPYAYPVKPIAATASSAQAGMGPEKTIDGSGLTADLHGVEPTTMWLSAGAQPNWIQYEFDNVYRLHEMKIWNSNQLIETFLGFGAKSVTIETSTDGTIWTAVADVPEFARAPGAATYAANIIVPLGGVQAKYVKLTINTTWGGVAPQTGLSEVRFSSIPVQARAPQPAQAATGVSIDTALDWRPGREAASHKVFFGPDQAAVAAGTAVAKTVADHGFDPGELSFGTTYYWKVDEVGDSGTYPGELWSFTTQEYAVVEDFESYTDDEGSRIYETWIDGWENKTGSVVGYLQAPFAERTIIHGGKQSMPLEYNNLKTPFYSETEREFTPVQNWTVNGADTLSLWFRGRPVAFLDKGDGAFTVSGSGHDIWDTADDFRFVYKRLSGNGSVTVKVESLINTNAWAKAGVMIRESLEAGSPMAYMIQSFSQGVSFGWRPTVNANAASIPATTGVVAPQWVRLTRTGNAFTAQYSANGTTWTDIKNADGTVTSTTINMAGTVYIGLCVTSHNTATTTTAQFSGAATTGGVTGAWQQVWIGDDPDLTNGAAGLYVAVEDSTGKSAVVVHPDPAAAALGAWTQWKIPYSSLTGVNLARVKKLHLGVGDRASPKAGGAGTLYIDDIGFGRPAVK